MTRTLLLFIFVVIVSTVLFAGCTGESEAPTSTPMSDATQQPAPIGSPGPSPTAIPTGMRFRAEDLISGLRQLAECGEGNLGLALEQGVWRTSCDRGTELVLLACDMLGKDVKPPKISSYGEMGPAMLEFCRRALALMRDEPARTADPKFGPLADEIQTFIGN
jgi:hypothetical protein